MTKSESRNAYIVVAIFLLLVALQLGQALWLGRMFDIFDEFDFLFFFESPILFSLHFAGYLWAGYGLWRALRKHHRRDRNPLL